MTHATPDEVHPVRPSKSYSQPGPESASAGVSADVMTSVVRTNRLASRLPRIQSAPLHPRSFVSFSPSCTDSYCVMRAPLRASWRVRFDARFGGCAVPRRPRRAQRDVAPDSLSSNAHHGHPKDARSGSSVAPPRVRNRVLAHASRPVGCGKLCEGRSSSGVGACAVWAPRRVRDAVPIRTLPNSRARLPAFCSWQAAMDGVLPPSADRFPLGFGL